MQTAIQELIGLLSRFRDAYNGYLSLQEKERILLRDLDPEGLEENSNQKETLSLEIRVLEETRLRLCETLAKHYSVKPEEVTISFLAKRNEGEVGETLTGYARDFDDLMERIQKLDRQNRALVQSSLNLARNMQRLLLGLISETPVYQSTGRLTGVQESPGMLCRTI